eukprot:scaffold265_cov131-Cylindrotheca_fusiformis.AAC.10
MGVLCFCNCFRLSLPLVDCLIRSDVLVLQLSSLVSMRVISSSPKVEGGQLDQGTSRTETLSVQNTRPNWRHTEEPENSQQRLPPDSNKTEAGGIHAVLLQYM